MTRSTWSNPHPRRTEVAPAIVVVSTFAFAATLGYQIAKVGVAITEKLRGKS